MTTTTPLSNHHASHEITIALPLLTSRPNSPQRYQNGNQRGSRRNSHIQQQQQHQQQQQEIAVQRIRVAMVSQWTFVALFIGLLVTVILIAPPWDFPECDLFQTSWSLIWTSLMIVHMLLLVSISHIRWSDRRPSRPFYHLQRALRSLNTIWFFCGIKPLFWDAICNETATRLGRSLWWLQATFFLIPLFCYLLICLCFPCIIVLLHRLRVPSPNELPTPEWIIPKLEVHKYSVLLEILRNEFGASEVEFTQPQHVAAAEALRNNPLVEILSSAAGVVGTTGPSHSSTTSMTPGRSDQSPLLEGSPNTRLIVEKSCPICMLDFDGDDDVMLMPCDKRHFFHIECVTQWLKNSQFCPICRANIVTLVSPVDTPTGQRTHRPSLISQEVQLNGTSQTVELPITPASPV